MRKEATFREDKGERKGGALRRGILVGLVLLALGLMVYPKVKKGEAIPPAQPSSSPAATPVPRQERSLREAGYEKDIRALQAIVDNADNDEAVRQQAAQQISCLVENHQTELAIEEALIAAGFSPRLVVMQGEAITVSLMSAELSGTDGVTILSLCVAHSDVAVENIRIMTVDE